jgi:hypothetical protein
MATRWRREWSCHSHQPVHDLHRQRGQRKRRRSVATAADAYRHLESGEATGKVVIDITRSGSMSEVFLRSGRLPTTVITEEGTW